MSDDKKHEKGIGILWKINFLLIKLSGHSTNENSSFINLG